ncbi:phasin family protein [Hyphomicrobium sp.]|uniref:phasin family protein n=1 Tax=Hyphomicrobium sp. TaxID=82 RepID=UPI002BA754BC|nr:phasin family protein [Hyphomicrobium sp.]HRN87051.1 phasin family protein [Hyphomicrobium sp.]HRQ26369.1 phasin family protein [Hyphomicrobium sp.]
MGTQTGYDAYGIGSFASVFQNYLSAFETVSQGTPPLGAGFPTAFDTQAFTQQATAPLKAVARAQLEMLGLVNRRVQAYMQAPAKLAQCRTSRDVLNEQMAFWQEAAEQYASSGRKIADAWSAALPLGAPYGVVDTLPADRDYIDFNGAASAKARTRPRVKAEPENKARRVA